MASTQPNASVAWSGQARVAIGCVLIRRQSVGGEAWKPPPLPITPGQVPDALWEANLLPRGRAFQQKSADSGFALIDTPSEIRDSGSCPLHIV